MSRFRVEKLGNYFGVGAVVVCNELFGSTRWTVLPPEDELDVVYKKWTCIHNGKTKYASIHAENMDNFYKAAWIEACGLPSEEELSV